jgi:hypothetical protein
VQIVNSEGLDGLDLPDPHDGHGFDGDREWGHSDDEQVVPHKMSFCAGYRGLENAKTSDSESHRSSIRPLTNKTITFDPATKEEVEEVAGSSRRDVSRGRSRSRSRSRSPNPKEGAQKKTIPFEILRTKAAGVADQMRQRFNKISLPIRPKLNQWEGSKLSRKRHKKKAAAAAPQEGEEEEEAAAVEVEEEAQAEFEENFEPMDTTEQEFPFLPQEPTEPQVAEAPKNKEEQKKEKEAKAEEQRKEKEAVAEEKKRKQKEQDDEKKLKAEEKKKEQDELKRKKAEEKQLAKEESDKKKAEEKAAKQKIQEEAKKAKLEEQLAKARETEEIERQKNEELLRLREQEAAEKSAASSITFEAQPAEETLLLEEQQQEQEQPQTPTPTGTGSRRKKIKKTFVQLPQLPKMPDLPQLPHFDLDFKRKVIKRSKTPPGRPTPPKMKFKKDAGGGSMEETENQLAAQYASEIEARKLAMEEDNAEEHDEATEMVRHIRFPEPPIFVTQPSNEPSEESGSHKDWKSFPSSSGRSEEEPAEDDQVSGAPGKSQVGTKERFDKFGKQLKGFGLKSKEIASKKSKSMGATMKVIGQDLHKLGAKTSEKFQATIEEIKAKQDAAKARTKEKAKEAEDIVHEQTVVPLQYESATEPRKKFRFRRRDDSQEEPEQEGGKNKQPEQYQNTQDLRQSGGERSKEKEEEGEGEKITRSQLLGRAERDWESPLDLAHSRDVSEEPFMSGNASSRDSPPGSSLASSTFAAQPVRKQGVLQEIDSDEFFLREKGISEGEDEEEINRFLVEELRQAFRLQENALAGFDLDDPPERPGRQPRKPLRKEQEKSYQTFPPERPRRKAPGYVSDYLKENEEEDMEEDQCSTQEERGSYQEDPEQFEDDGIRRVKEELDKIENEEENIHQDYVDDGRYEPISEELIEPVKPQRRKKQKSTPLYYNTVAGNEWMREVDDQVMRHEEEEEEEEGPQVPRRTTSKSGSIPLENDENEITFVDAEDRSNSRQSSGAAAQVGGGSTNRVDVVDDGDENFEYVDEAGYAVVHKGHQETPRTVPRRHRKSSGNGSKSNSLKRQGQGSSTNNGEAQFFSLPRPAPRTFHIVPPSRPQRNYSTLKPRRPPRHRSNHSLTKSNKGDKQEGTSRPSTAIGIMHGMHGRPLPPPPRPERPQILNDLDHTSIERSVGARHYANFVDDSGPRDVEEINVARNVSLLGRGDLGGDINIGIQTDPLQEYENEAHHAAVTSFDDITRRVQQLR